MKNPLTMFGRALTSDDPQAEREAQRAMGMDSYRPMGGATSMDEAEMAMEAQELASDVNEITMMFGCVVSNILADADLDTPAKMAALQTAIDDLGTRVSALTPSAAATGKKDVGIPTEADYAAGEMEGSIADVTEPGGAPRWLAIYSNRYQDKLKETLPEAAHLDFVEYVERTKEYPSLRLWHIPGADIGHADWIDYADGFMVATGTYDAPEYAQRLKELGPLRTSHGFKYRVKDLLPDGTYRAYRTYEISVLPTGREANTLQGDFDPGEALMPLTAARREFAERVLGADKIKDLEGMLVTLKSKADAEGIGYREVIEGMAELSAPPGAAPPPASAPPPPPPAAGGTEGVGAAELAAALAPLTQGIAALTQRLDAQDGAIKSLAAGDEEIRTALRMAAPRSAPAAGGFAASAAASTAVGDGDAAVANAQRAADSAQLPPGTPAHLAPYVSLARAALGAPAVNGTGGAS